jgi:hypothetical protein
VKKSGINGALLILQLTWSGCRADGTGKESQREEREKDFFEHGCTGKTVHL